LEAFICDLKTTTKDMSSKKLREMVSPFSPPSKKPTSDAGEERGGDES